MAVVIEKLFSIFLIVGVGYLLHKLNIVKSEHTPMLTALLIDVFLSIHDS